MKNKDYLLRYQYSWVLVPLFTLLYILYPDLRIYLQYLMFVTGWVGIIVAWMIKLPLHLFLLSALGHLPVFIGLFYKESFFQFNYTQIIFLLIGILLIIKIPFWPYYISRLTFLYVFLIVSFIYFLISFIQYKKLIKINKK